MATAMELSRPELGGAYDITVYQLGWRLGGKGASGRGPHGRIEEHGLHVWMGFYDNAFRLMRDAYAELDRPEGAPLRTVAEAFARSSHIGLANWEPATDWTVWSSIFPDLPGEPGEALDGSPANPFTVSGYLVRMAGVMARLFETAYGRPTSERPDDDLRGMANESLVELALRAADLEHPLAVRLDLVGEPLTLGEGLGIEHRVFGGRGLQAFAARRGKQAHECPTKRGE